MQRSVCAISIGLNLVLLGIASYLVVAAARAPKSGSSSPSTSLASPGKTGTSGAIHSGAIPQTSGPSFNWSRVESPDYQIYIRNLRAIGCPEETVRDIIVADVGKLYERKRAASLPPSRTNFWQSSFDAISTEDRQADQKLRLLDKEHSRVLTELLGTNWEQAANTANRPSPYDEAHYGNLPAEKRDKVRTWEETYFDRESEIQSRAIAGVLSTEDEQALKNLKKERQDELARILEPAEFEDYELRNSPVAQRLRDGLVGIELTADEFRSIFRWQKPLEGRVGNDAPSADSAPAGQPAQQQKILDDQIRNLLGDERFAEYQRGQDPDFQSLYQFVQGFQLSPNVAAGIYDLQKQTAQQQSALAANPALSEPERSQAMADIQRKNNAVVKGLIGDKAFDLYRKLFDNRGSD